MNKILFLRSDKALLPEIEVYIEYFNRTSDFVGCDSSVLGDECDMDDFDIIWEFKGFGGNKSDHHIIVQEYASLSTGVFPKIKNTMKTILNPKPDLRIFLNEEVKKGFKFNDNIKSCYRDMGIRKEFLNVRNKKKEYDFIYIGAISKDRKIDKLLYNINKTKCGKICLVGEPEIDIYKKYKYNSNIIFTGKVAHREIPNIASKAIYGINYIPNKYPYNIQTSTKLLEYLTLGLKVITTDYKWIRDFEQRHNCSFYKLTNMNFSIKSIEKHVFRSEFNAEDFLWDNILENSGILSSLRNLIN